jgi:hypothetical protein
MTPAQSPAPFDVEADEAPARAGTAGSAGRARSREPLAPIRAVLGGDGAAAVIVAASIITMIGSLGPWTSTIALNTPGIDGGGRITLMAAIIAAILARSFAAGVLDADWTLRGALLAGLVALGVASYNLIDIRQNGNSQLPLDGTRLHPGWGLFIAVGGAALLVVSLWPFARDHGAALVRRSGRRDAPASE